MFIPNLLGFPDISMGMGGGAFVQLPLEVAATQSRINSGQATNATRKDIVFRTEYYIGQDVDDLVTNWNNWLFTGSGFQNGYNPYTVLELSIEAPNGTVVPLYKDGSRSFTLNVNDYEVLTDPVPASAFGYTTIPKATEWFLKGKITLNVAGNSLAVISEEATSNYSVHRQTAFYNDSETLVSATDTAGKYTAVSGTPLFGALQLIRPILLGHPTVVTETWGIVGDSVSAGFSDNGATVRGVFTSKGFFPRATMGNGLDTRAGLILARGGTNSTHYIGNPYIQRLYKYAKNWMEGHATNDLGSGGTVTLAQEQVRKTTLWSEMLAGGAKRIFPIEPFYRVLISGSNVSLDDQTYSHVPTWGPGGIADQLQAWYYTNPSGLVSGVFPTSMIRDVTTTRKALVDNVTPNFTQSDGVHPNTFANSVMGDDYIPRMRSYG